MNRARQRSAAIAPAMGELETTYKKTNPMNAGRTITSRDSQDVRHIAAARQARSGRPRWKKDAARPQTRSASTVPQQRITNCFGGERKASIRQTTTNKPSAAPISVVSRMTDHAGLNSAASFFEFGLAPRQVLACRPGLSLAH